MEYAKLTGFSHDTDHLFEAPRSLFTRFLHSFKGTSFGQFLANLFLMFARFRSTSTI